MGNPIVINLIMTILLDDAFRGGCCKGENIFAVLHNAKCGGAAGDEETRIIY